MSVCSVIPYLISTYQFGVTPLLPTFKLIDLYLQKKVSIKDYNEYLNKKIISTRANDDENDEKTLATGAFARK